MRVLQIARILYLLVTARAIQAAADDVASSSVSAVQWMTTSQAFHDDAGGMLGDTNLTVGHVADPCSRWMAQNSDRIKNTPLLNLTLPGSHDSAAYDLNGHIMPGQLPWALRQLLIAAETLGLPPERYIIKWSEAQSLSLAEQLQNGIRFVDLRAGHNGSAWVACHTAEGPLIQGVFHAIDEFLSQHEQEVLVVELTHTYNGQDELSELASMISETVGHHMAPCCRLNRTMQEFWDDGRRLVFVSSVPTGDSRLWWPPASIHNSYANSDEVEVMWYYNRDILSTYSPNATQFFKMSWTLTPQITTLLHGLFAYPSSLAELASKANTLLPDFIDTALAEGRSEFPQILIADEVQDSDIVLMTLHMNRLHSCKYVPMSRSALQ